MTNPLIAGFQKDAERILQHLQVEFSKLQTGRANPAIVENVDVEAYGQRVQLKTVAGVSVQDARSIVIQPWDKSLLGAVEKALQIANVGANPVNDGLAIRLNLPPMTEERRKDLVKIVHKLGEEARISVRQVRQTAHDKIKEEKDEDVKRTAEGALQKEVDAANGKIDDLRKKKEEEIMKI